jgi:hypothetical protein
LSGYKIGFQFINRIKPSTFAYQKNIDGPQQKTYPQKVRGVATFGAVCPSKLFREGKFLKSLIYLIIERPVAS